MLPSCITRTAELGSSRTRQLLQAAAATTALRAQPAPEKKMRLGVVTGISKDVDAAIKRVHDFGFPTCQVGVGGFDDAPALRAALANMAWR